MNSNDLTLYIALYGAVLSTIALLWNVLRDRNDRSELTISVGTTQIFFTDSYTATYLKIELTNRGRRNLTVTEIGYKSSSGKNLIPIETQDLPKELGEGQTHSVAVSFDSVGSQDKVEFIFARDSLKRIAKSAQAPLSKLAGQGEK